MILTLKMRDAEGKDSGIGLKMSMKKGVDILDQVRKESVVE